MAVFLRSLQKKCRVTESALNDLLDFNVILNLIAMIIFFSLILLPLDLDAFIEN